jgi:hypothetical protein
MYNTEHNIHGQGVRYLHRVEFSHMMTLTIAGFVSTGKLTTGDIRPVYVLKLVSKSKSLSKAPRIPHFGGGMK